jgi:hypothetical protein
MENETIQIAVTEEGRIFPAEPFLSIVCPPDIVEGLADDIVKQEIIETKARLDAEFALGDEQVRYNCVIHLQKLCTEKISNYKQRLEESAFIEQVRVISALNSLVDTSVLTWNPEAKEHLNGIEPVVDSNGDTKMVGFYISF